MICAGVLLAAGASRRFGPDDKLLAPLNGRTLIEHAANALRASHADPLIAVVRSTAVADRLSGFEIATPADPDPLQSDSLRAGITQAQDLGAEKVVVLLGDMPFVTADMINATIKACTEDTPAAVMDGTRPIPPACFPKSCFKSLLMLSGDRGAASLLSEATLLAVPDSSVIDVDTSDGLVKAEGMV